MIFERQNNQPESWLTPTKGCQQHIHTRAGFYAKLNGSEGTGAVETVEVDDVLTYKIFKDSANTTGLEFREAAALEVACQPD